MSLQFKKTTISLIATYLGAAILLGVAFLHPLLWWSAFFGVILLLKAVEETPSWKFLLWATVLAGSVQFTIVLSWIWYTHPLNGFGMTPTMSFVAVGITWFLTAVVLGSSKVFFTAALYKWHKKKYFLFAVPVLWLVSDIFGAFLYTILSYGPGTILNANLSFGWLGYLLAEQAFLLPLANMGGVFLLTILYVFIALWLRRIICGRYKYRWFVAIGIVILLFFTGELMVAERQHDESLVVATLETNTASLLGVSGEDKTVYYDDLMNKVIHSLEQGAEYIILPEGADLTGAFVDKQNMLEFLAISAKRDIVLIDSGWQFHTEETSFVRARIYDTKAMKVYELDKQYLVPQGEFMPYFFAVIMSVFGYADGVEYYQKKFDYVPGIMKDSPEIPAYIPGILFCFESVNPLGVKKAASVREVPFIAHPVSHAWFNEPTIMWHQLDQMLKVNARFGDKTVYQAANRYEAKRY